MTYQAKIDNIPFMQPYEAQNDEAAMKYAALCAEAVDCDGQYLTCHGETLTVERIA